MTLWLKRVPRGYWRYCTKPRRRDAEGSPYQCSDVRYYVSRPWLWSGEVNRSGIWWWQSSIRHTTPCSVLTDVCTGVVK